MTRYKICYEGYIIVEANSLEEALRIADEDYYIYEELEYTAIEKYCE